MSAIDDVIEYHTHQVDRQEGERARAELAAARKALEQAREIIESAVNVLIMDGRGGCYAVEYGRAFLAAHAPQAEQEQTVVDKV